MIMIKLTDKQINGATDPKEVYVSVDKITYMHATYLGGDGDFFATEIRLVCGSLLCVKETPKQIMDMLINFKG